MIEGIFDPTMTYIEHGLTTSLRRQVVLQGNIANLDTPGFTPRDVDFDAAMKQALEPAQVGLRKTSAQHIQAQSTELIEGAIYERPDTEPGLDGNAVDLDAQMARMSQNALLYRASTKLMSKKLALLRYAVTEGAG